MRLGEFTPPPISLSAQDIETELSFYMVTQSLYFSSVDGLRRFVNRFFCDHYQLQLGAFQMSERILKRDGKPCGIYFCLHGPRAVRFTAIWENERNQVLFYEATGERFQKFQLSEGPKLEATLG